MSGTTTSTHTSSTTTTTNRDTGASETSTTWELSNGEGITEASGTTNTATEADGSSCKIQVTRYHDKDGGKTDGAIVAMTETDASGKTTYEQTIEFREDGTKVNTMANPDGTVTITEYDENGKVISTETVDENGEPVEQGKDGFWDIDIIYGGPDGKYGTDDDMLLMDMDAGQFKAAGGVDMLVETVGEEHAEMMIDHFDFFM